MNTVRSPLVPTSNVRLLETYSVEGLIKEWKSSFDIDIANELNGLEEIFLYRCEESQLDFFLPLSAAGTSHLYHELQKFDWFYIQDKWEFNEAIKDLKDCQKILEVGCGEGFFIERALKNLKLKSIRGIELSEEAVKRAQRKNLPVDQQQLKDLVDKGETFDAVCGFQILEHLSNPLDHVDDMVKVIKPDGRLILCVPNKESFLKYQHNLLDMPPHHMTRWTIATFRYLENLFPLKMIRTCYEPLAKYHISGYVAAYTQHFRTRFPLGKHILSERTIGAISTILKKTGLYCFLRGQSLYVMFKKL